MTGSIGATRFAFAPYNAPGRDGALLHGELVPASPEWHCRRGGVPERCAPSL